MPVGTHSDMGLREVGREQALTNGSEQARSSLLRSGASSNSRYGALYAPSTRENKTHADSDADGVADAVDRCVGTAAGVRVDSQGCAVLCNMKLTLPFASNQDNVSHDRIQILKRLAALLNENPLLQVLVTGHSDNIGSSEANYALSRRRAENIYHTLTEQLGVPAERISVEAHGGSRPIVSNRSEAGRARNRRVDVLVAGAYQDTGTWIAQRTPYQLQFAANTNVLSPVARDRLDAIGKHMQLQVDEVADIAGHSDTSGNQKLNLQLSQARAQSVRQYLVERWGIAPSRLTTAGLGDTNPIASNDSAQGRATNRRVSIHLHRAETAAPFQAQAKQAYSRRPDQAAPWRLYSVPKAPLHAQAAIEFPEDTATVSPEGLRRLESIGAILSQRPDVRVVVQGYSDATGNAALDKAISQERAEAVKSVLMDRYQLSPERLDTKSYGAEMPIASNATEAGRQRNRRVVLQILSMDGAQLPAR